jgi:hypothetical protein
MDAMGATGRGIGRARYNAQIQDSLIKTCESSLANFGAWTHGISEARTGSHEADRMSGINLTETHPRAEAVITTRTQPSRIEFGHGERAPQALRGSPSLFYATEK